MQKEIQEQVNKGMMLPLMEEFYTIQGEGFHKGTAAYFIRVGGCDVGCHWCDVKESWNPESHPPTAIKAIAQNANKYSKTIVITGGEPLTWDMGPLTSLLKKMGMTLDFSTETITWNKASVPMKSTTATVIESLNIDDPKGVDDIVVHIPGDIIPKV